MDCKIVPAVDTKYNKHPFARTPEVRGWQKILDFRFMMTLLYFNISVRDIFTVFLGYFMLSKHHKIMHYSETNDINWDHFQQL